MTKSIKDELLKNLDEYWTGNICLSDIKGEIKVGNVVEVKSYDENDKPITEKREILYINKVFVDGWDILMEWCYKVKR